MTLQAPAGELPETERDAAARLHTVLGRAASDRGVLSPGSEPGSAIYHWTQAIELQRGGAHEELGPRESPLLVANLGSAYEGAGEWREALHLYRQAIHGFTVSGDTALAMGLLQRHRNLERAAGLHADSTGRRWIEDYHKRFEALAITPVDPVAGELEKLPQPVQKISETVRFAWDDASLSDEAKAALERLVQAHRDSLHAMEIRIEGHTDSTGPDHYNYDLGLRRAEAVWRYLLAAGVPARAMSLTSYGKDRLQNPGDSEEAHKVNRRALIVLVQAPPR